MKPTKMLNVEISAQSKSFILDKILKNIEGRHEFIHVVSLNPENMVIAHQLKEFAKILSESSIQLIDGIGIRVGGFILGYNAPNRISGSDFMEELLFQLRDRELSVVLLGGKGNIAEQLADCYSKKYKKISFYGSAGFSDINNPLGSEIEDFLRIITDRKPHILFVAYGSPAQEIFLDRFKSRLRGVVCMGVGGGFDFAVGKVRRAPHLFRKIGLEWFFRLMIQPWRIKRQWRLALFLYLVLLQKIKYLFK